MGLYIETPASVDKAEYLKSTYRAVPALPIYPPPKDKMLICIIINGSFTVADIIYNEYEFYRVTKFDDHRMKYWWHVDKEVVAKLNPLVQPYI
jgi:hypothetical protein